MGSHTPPILVAPVARACVPVIALVPVSIARSFCRAGSGPGTKEARDLVAAGLVLPGASREESGQSEPSARATAVAGHPVGRDPSRLLPLARFARKAIRSLVRTGSRHVKAS